MNRLFFFLISNIGAKIGSNLKTIFKKSGYFAQNLTQNWADWHMNGSLFLEKWVLVWVYFQISQRHLPTKTNFEYLPPRLIPLF